MESLNAKSVVLQDQMLHGTREQENCLIVENMKFLRLATVTSLLSRVSLVRMKIHTPVVPATLVEPSHPRLNSRSNTHQDSETLPSLTRVKMPVSRFHLLAILNQALSGRRMEKQLRVEQDSRSRRKRDMLCCPSLTAARMT